MSDHQVAVEVNAGNDKHSLSEKLVFCFGKLDVDKTHFAVRNKNGVDSNFINIDRIQQIRVPYAILIQLMHIMRSIDRRNTTFVYASNNSTQSLGLSVAITVLFFKEQLSPTSLSIVQAMIDPKACNGETRAMMNAIVNQSGVFTNDRINRNSAKQFFPTLEELVEVGDFINIAGCPGIYEVIQIGRKLAVTGDNLPSNPCFLGDLDFDRIKLPKYSLMAPRQKSMIDGMQYSFCVNLLRTNLLSIA